MEINKMYLVVVQLNAGQQDGRLIEARFSYQAPLGSRRNTTSNNGRGRKAKNKEINSRENISLKRNTRVKDRKLANDDYSSFLKWIQRKMKPLSTSFVVNILMRTRYKLL
jgi:hypothetical protein